MMLEFHDSLLSFVFMLVVIIIIIITVCIMVVSKFYASTASSEWRRRPDRRPFPAEKPRRKKEAVISLSKVNSIPGDASMFPHSDWYVQVPPLEIFVQVRSWEIITLEAHFSDTIGNLKEKVKDKTGFPAEEQRLFFQGKTELKDDRTVSDYNIQNKSTVNLFLQIDRLEVTILAEGRRLVTLEVNTTDSILELKQEVHDKTGVPLERQSLSFSGIELENERTISAYNIRNKSSINLVVKIKVYFVNALTPQKRMTLELKPKDTIGSVKDKIHAKTKISSYQQVLKFNGEELDDGHTLKYYNIKSNSQLLLYEAVEISVEMLNGTGVRLKLFKSNTIENVKVRLNLAEDIPWDMQRLSFRGKLLRHSDTLSDLNIQNNSILRYVVMITVHIKMPNEDQISVDVNLDDKIRNVRDRIQARGAIPPDQLCLLVYNGEKLNNRYTLRHYKLRNGSILSLVKSGEPRETPEIEARNRDGDDDERDYGSNKLRRRSKNPRPRQQEINKDISKEPSTSSGPGDSREDLGSAVSGYSSFSSKEVTSLHPESWSKAEDVLQLDKLSIVSEPSRKSAHEGESVEGPKDDHSKDPGEVTMVTEYEVSAIREATMKFEAKHEECIRVLPYIKDGQIVVQLYVYSGKSGIPKYLKEEAQTRFEAMGVKLEWSDLYNNSDIILKVEPLECSNGKPKILTALQADEMNEVIEKNLRVLSKYRNLTSVQASFKIKNSKQLDKPCITIYVLGKGFIPLGESRFPDALEGYPVDVVNGFWTRASPKKPWEPKSTQKPSKTLCSGVSIGVQGKEAAGTLGAILKNGSTFYALSCHHVMNSEQSKRIVHPALYDHLNYLRYYLAQYRRDVKDVTGLETQGSVEDLTTREALVSNFKELKSRKDLDIQVQVYSSECLELIENAEKDFERGQDPPREIGEWVDGVCDNFQWSDNKEYFIDAAIAKLFDKEVESLKKKTARLIGDDGKPCGCSPADRTTISNADKLCKSGRTTIYTEIGDRILGNLEAPHFIMPPLYEKDLPFLSCHLKVFACERCDKKKFKVTDSRAPLSCDKCDDSQATFRNEFWRKRVLCIREERTRFADDGDSGSVIFKIVEKEGGNDLFGLGLLFAIDESQYKRLYFASPLRIVLDALNNKLPTGSNLELVSNYNE